MKVWVLRMGVAGEHAAHMTAVHKTLEGAQQYAEEWMRMSNDDWSWRNSDRLSAGSALSWITIESQQLKP